jgi:hypothetical protein
MSVRDEYDGGNVTRLPLRPKRFKRREPHEIPPRPWLYGTILQRGFTSMIIAPGGTGKTQLGLAIAADIASGRGFLGFHIFERVPVWYLNLEDPEVEIERRLAAIRMIHGLGWDEIDEWLYLHNGRERPVCIAAKGPDGQHIIYPDHEAVVAAARACGIGLIVVDPFARSHSLVENSNEEMNAAMAAWNAVGEEVGCGIALLQHVRKGFTGDVEDSRGARALIDGARMCLTLQHMATEECEAVGVPTEDRHRFVRLLDGKVNMAPQATEATWFEMREVELGNPTPVYVNGDRVSALARWVKPSAWEGLDNHLANHILDSIDAGFAAGRPYSAASSAQARAAWRVVQQHCPDKAETACRSIVLTWVKNGLLFMETYRDKAEGKDRLGLRVNATKRPS